MDDVSPRVGFPCGSLFGNSGRAPLTSGGLIGNAFVGGALPEHNSKRVVALHGMSVLEGFLQNAPSVICQMCGTGQAPDLPMSSGQIRAKHASHRESASLRGVWPCQSMCGACSQTPAGQPWASHWVARRGARAQAVHEALARQDAQGGPPGAPPGRRPRHPTALARLLGQGVIPPSQPHQVRCEYFAAHAVA